MTTAQKHRYFAAHWGQDCITDEDSSPDTWIVNHETLGSQFVRIDKSWLRLRSIESITDEDVKELSKLIYGHTNQAPEFIRVAKKLASESEFSFDDYAPREVILMIDFFRGKGYALPFEGIPVPELISEGWLVIDN